jgi:hypothetical protein
MIVIVGSREELDPTYDLKLARAFLVLAKLAEAADSANPSERRIAGANGRRPSALPPKVRRDLNG